MKKLNMLIRHGASDGCESSPAGDGDDDVEEHTERDYHPHDEPSRLRSTFNLRY